VWRAFGPDVPNYVEPFFGSGAVLLARPGGPGKIETVNDADRFLANFWRAVKDDPEAVAQWSDWPVNEADLHARHLWLVNQAEFKERMHTDPDYHDVKIAGWWVWGICAWIGGGWCRDTNAHNHHLPSLGNDRGLNGVSAPPALAWFKALQERLRNVRVACGDFERVLGDSVLGKGKGVGGRRPCAVFLDPPYRQDIRSDELYAEDERGVAEMARDWAIEHGDDPELRIALCGYEGEHEMPSNWTCVAWKGSRGYASGSNENRERERIWFSPHCLPLEKRQRELFAT
jgi:DNA adenine methylase